MGEYRFLVLFGFVFYIHTYIHTYINNIHAPFVCLCFFVCYVFISCLVVLYFAHETTLYRSPPTLTFTGDKTLTDPNRPTLKRVVLSPKCKDKPFFCGHNFLTGVLCNNTRTSVWRNVSVQDAVSSPIYLFIYSYLFFSCFFFL